MIAVCLCSIGTKNVDLVLVVQELEAPVLPISDVGGVSERPLKPEAISDLGIATYISAIGVSKAHVETLNARDLLLEPPNCGHSGKLSHFANYNK